MQLKLFTRIKSDFFRKSKIQEYKTLLEFAANKGYVFLTLVDCYKSMLDGNLPKKYIVIRHDIDSHVLIAKKMYQIEKSLDIKSSYYFRIETLDVDFIQTLTDNGNEVSYHNEELADYFKSQGLNKVYELSDELRLILQSNFKNNINLLRKKYGMKILSTVAHGDFVNRYVALFNNDFLDNHFLNECEILVEGYNKQLISNFDAFISDSHLSNLFQNDENPFVRLTNNENLYILIHPNSWENKFTETIKLNLLRFLEGICFKLGIKYPYRPKL